MSLQRKENVHISTQLDDIVQEQTTIYMHPHACTHTHTHTHTCAHTNTIQTVGAKDNNTRLKMLREEKCLEFWEGRERIRVSDILGEVVSNMRTKTGERAKAIKFAVEVSEFE